MSHDSSTTPNSQVYELTDEEFAAVERDDELIGFAARRRTWSWDEVMGKSSDSSNPASITMDLWTYAEGSGEDAEEQWDMDGADSDLREVVARLLPEGVTVEGDTYIGDTLHGPKPVDLDWAGASTLDRSLPTWCAAFAETYGDVDFGAILDANPRVREYTVAYDSLQRHWMLSGHGITTSRRLTLTRPLTSDHGGNIGWTTETSWNDRTIELTVASALKVGRKSVTAELGGSYDGDRAYAVRYTVPMD